MFIEQNIMFLKHKGINGKTREANNVAVVS